MPNFNNWRNWGTNILIRLGLQDQHYAHAFATVDPVYEPEEEEVDLGATVFAWGWFRRAVRSVAKVFKPVTKVVKAVYKPVAKVVDKVGANIKRGAKDTVKTVGKAASAVGRGVKDVVTDPVRAAQNVLTFGTTERERTAAKKAHAEAEADSQKAKAEYEAFKTESDKNLAASRAKYEAQKLAGEKASREGAAALKAAQATRAKSETEARAAAGARRTMEGQQKRLSADTLARAKELADKRKSKKERQGRAPGIGGVTVRGPGALGGTGRTGSKTRSARDVAERYKKGGLGGV